MTAEEGTESSGSIASRTRQELWTLTQTGNWELFKRDINGNNACSEFRVPSSEFRERL